MANNIASVASFKQFTNLAQLYPRASISADISGKFRRVSSFFFIDISLWQFALCKFIQFKNNLFLSLSKKF
jgi:hypothetical protein